MALDSVSFSLNFGQSTSFCFGIINPLALSHSKCTCMVKVVTAYTCMHKMPILYNRQVDMYEI